MKGRGNQITECGAVFENYLINKLQTRSRSTGLRTKIHSIINDTPFYKRQNLLPLKNPPDNSLNQHYNKNVKRGRPPNPRTCGFCLWCEEVETISQ